MNYKKKSLVSILIAFLILSFLVGSIFYLRKSEEPTKEKVWSSPEDYIIVNHSDYSLLKNTKIGLKMKVVAPWEIIIRSEGVNDNIGTVVIKTPETKLNESGGIDDGCQIIFTTKKNKLGAESLKAEIQNFNEVNKKSNDDFKKTITTIDKNIQGLQTKIENKEYYHSRIQFSYQNHVSELRGLFFADSIQECKNDFNNIIKTITLN